MTTRQVTIFGGSGFIGRYVVERMADRDWVVRVAVRHPRQAHFLKPLGHVGQIVPVQASLQDEDSVARAVDGVDAVVNLVGILYEKGAQTFGAVHVEGARRVAEKAAEAGAQSLVQISAIGADPGSESEYARSKAAGEEAVRAAFPDATILRPSIVFGPEDEFFNRFAAMARLSPALPLIGGGKTRFQPVYVGDVADAVATAITSKKHRGELYELGGPKTYNFKELMEIILREIRRKRLLLPLPVPLAKLQASVLELLPVPPLTVDQVKQLETDNVVDPKAKGFAELGIDPHALDVIVPTYLERYRRGGRFTASPDVGGPI